ncbi:NfeD family protein [Erysipelotrichaceae bacterium HCN-30851]
MVFVWIAISIGALLIELLTPSALISIWFAVGGVIGAVASLVHLPVEVQIACFAIVSIVSMLIVRPIASRYLRGNTVATNADRFLGENAEVIQMIKKNEWGQVKVNNTIWHAVSIDGEEIEEHAMVKVLAIEGAKLLVRRIDK